MLHLNNVPGVSAVLPCNVKNMIKCTSTQCHVNVRRMSCLFEHSVAINACKRLPLLADTNTRGSISFKSEWITRYGSCSNVYRNLLGTHLTESISLNPTDTSGIISSIGVALQACKYDGVFDSTHQKVSLCTNDQQQDTNVRALTVAGRNNFCVPLKTMLTTACTTLDATTTVEQCERLFEKYLEFSSGGSKQQPPIIVQFLEQALGLHVKSTFSIDTNTPENTPAGATPATGATTDPSKTCFYTSNSPHRRSNDDLKQVVTTFTGSGSNFMTQQRRLILVQGILGGVGRFVLNPVEHPHAYAARRKFLLDSLASLFPDVAYSALPSTIDKMLNSQTFYNKFGVRFKSKFDEEWKALVVKWSAQLYFHSKIGKTEFIDMRRMSVVPKPYSITLGTSKLLASYPTVLQYSKDHYETDFEEKAVVPTAKIFGKDGPDILGTAVSPLRHFHRLMNEPVEALVWEKYSKKIFAKEWIILEKIRILPGSSFEDVPWPDELSYRQDAQYKFLCEKTSLKDLAPFCSQNAAWAKNKFAISDCAFESVNDHVGKGCTNDIIIQLKLSESEYTMFAECVIGDNPNEVRRSNALLKRVVKLKPFQPKRALSLKLWAGKDGTHISNLAGQRTGKSG